MRRRSDEREAAYRCGRSGLRLQTSRRERELARAGLVVAVELCNAGRDLRGTFEHLPGRVGLAEQVGVELEDRVLDCDVCCRRCERVIEHHGATPSVSVSRS